MGTRRERVVLELEDDLSPGLLRAAAAAKLLDRELSSLSGSAVRSSRSTQNINRDIDGVARSADKADRSINQLTGRLRVFADIAAVFGPSLIPLGGAGIAGIAGLASQLGFAAVAGGVLIGSMQGVGDALGALHKAHLDPTVENLEAAREAMEALSPAAREFAKEAHALLPLLKGLRDAGAEELFPGLTESLGNLERLAPKVETIMRRVGRTVGEIAASGTNSLTSDRWADFFDFIATEAPQSLRQLASTVGDLTHGLAELWMAFQPLNDSTGDWITKAAKDFDEWAAGLDQTKGFQDFVDYIRETGPQVAETVGALSNALVQVVQATAPLGGPSLRILESISKVIASIADSDLGTPIMAEVAALALYNRTLQATAALQAKFGASSAAGAGGMLALGGGAGSKASVALKGAKADASAMAAMWATAGARTEREAARMSAATTSLKGNLATLGKEAGRVAGPMAAMGLAVSGVGDEVGATNTAMFALLGSAAGLPGAIGGAAAGAFLDLQSQTSAANATMDDFIAKIDQLASSGGSASEIREVAEAAQAQNAAYEASAVAIGKYSQSGVLAGRVMDYFVDSESKSAEATKRAESAARAAAAAEKQRAEYQRAVAQDRAYLNRMQAERDALNQLVGALKAAQNATRAQFDAETNLRQALVDARKQADSNSEGIRGNSEAVLANRSALSQLASAWNDQSNKVKNNVGRYREMRQSLIEVATQMGVSREKAEALAKQLLDMPKKVETKVALRDEATAQAQRIKEALASIKDKTVTVRITQQGTVAKSPGFGPDHGADGTTVPKTGLPYADRHLYMLADGEEVTSNRRGQADRYRPVLKAINADLPRDVIRGMLASGGTAGKGKRVKGLDVEMVGGSGRAGRAAEAAAEAAALAADRAAAAMEDIRERAETAAKFEDERKQREKERDDAILAGYEKAWADMTRAAEEQVATAEKVRDEWQAAMQRVGQAATRAFGGDWITAVKDFKETVQEQRRGLWVGVDDRTTGALTAEQPKSWRDVANEQIAGLKARYDIIGELQTAGIRGGALEALLGQASNEQIRDMLAKGEVQDYQDLYNQRQFYDFVVQSSAGNAAYGPEHASANQTVADAVSQLAALTDAIKAARPVTVNEAVSAQATAREVARLIGAGVDR